MSVIYNKFETTTTTTTILQATSTSTSNIQNTSTKTTATATSLSTSSLSSSTTSSSVPITKQPAATQIINCTTKNFEKPRTSTSTSTSASTLTTTPIQTSFSSCGALTINKIASAESNIADGLCAPRKTCKFKKRNGKCKPIKLDLKKEDQAYFTLDSNMSSPGAAFARATLTTATCLTSASASMSTSSNSSFSNSTRTSQSVGSKPNFILGAQGEAVLNGLNKLRNDIKDYTCIGSRLGMGMGIDFGIGMGSGNQSRHSEDSGFSSSSLTSSNSSSLDSSPNNNNISMLNHGNMSHSRSHHYDVMSFQKSCKDNSMSEIIKGKLYVGSLENLNDIKDFKKYYITRIISAMNDYPIKNYYETINNCIKEDPKNGHTIINIKDRGCENILKYFDIVNKLIDENETGATYIHCHSGISRSITFCLAYLLKKLKCKNVPEAMDYIQAIRYKSCPNFGFLGQLTTYIKNLENSSDSGYCAQSEDEDMES